MAADIDIQSDFVSRLEKAFNDQQGALQQTRDDVNILKTGYGVIQRDMMSLTSAIEKLVTRFEESRKTNWPLLALMAGLLPIIIGGFGFFVTSYTTSTITPLDSKIIQNQATIKAMTDQMRDMSTLEVTRGKDLSLLGQTATTNSEILNRITDRFRTLEENVVKSSTADENSKIDRQQLNMRMGKIEAELAAEIADRRTQSATTRVQLAEIEQQFHSISNLENLRAAQQERLNSMLWEKSHPGERYPNGTFFPTSIFQGGNGPMNNNMTP